MSRKRMRSSELLGLGLDIQDTLANESNDGANEHQQSRWGEIYQKQEIERVTKITNHPDGFAHTLSSQPLQPS